MHLALDLTAGVCWVPDKARGARLKQARIAKGYATARAFARAMKIKEQRYYDYENGKNDFTATFGLKFAKALGVDYWWLITGISPGHYPDYTSDPFEGLSREQLDAVLTLIATMRNRDNR